jgi:hypothetical protein
MTPTLKDIVEALPATDQGELYLKLYFKDEKTTVTLEEALKFALWVRRYTMPIRKQLWRLISNNEIYHDGWLDNLRVSESYQCSASDSTKI